MSNEESFFDSRDAILAAIPHRSPFLFIDAINSWTESEIVCSYRFKEDEFFFAGHYPQSPIVPGVILLESAMQAGAIFTSKLLSSEETKTKAPVVGRMNDVKFKSVVRPGDTVEHTVVLKERMAGAYLFGAKTRIRGKLAASFEFIVTMANVSGVD